MQSNDQNKLIEDLGFGLNLLLRNRVDLCKNSIAEELKKIKENFTTREFFYFKHGFLITMK